VKLITLRMEFGIRLGCRTVTGLLVPSESCWTFNLRQQHTQMQCYINVR